MFTAGDLVIDTLAHRVTLRGQHGKLTRKEYDLLHVLTHHAGRVLTHQQILRDVWGPHHGEQVQHLRVFVGRLRQKIETNPADPKLLLNEPGVGYRLAAASADQAGAPMIIVDLISPRRWSFRTSRQAEAPADPVPASGGARTGDARHPLAWCSGKPSFSSCLAPGQELSRTPSCGHSMKVCAAIHHGPDSAGKARHFGPFSWRQEDRLDRAAQIVHNPRIAPFDPSTQSAM